MNLNNENQSFEELQDQVKFKIIELETACKGKSALEVACKETIEKLKQLYTNFYEWMKENQDHIEFQKKKEKLLTESEILISSLRTKISEVYESEVFQDKLQKGNAYLGEMSEKIVGVIQQGYQIAKESDSFKKVNKKMEELKNDEWVQDRISNFKRSTMQVVDHAYEKLQSALQTPDAEVEVDMNEENHNL